MSIRVVLTGGPSAGKTTLLDLLGKQFGATLAVAPEAASILFRGGFPRPVTFDDRLHTQRSIYALQKEIEQSAIDKCGGHAPLFCDRGSLDGAAYWEGPLKEFCFSMGTTLEKEISRYTAVLHMQTAAFGEGYSQSDVRTETPEQARVLDERIAAIWSQHPNYHFIQNDCSFIEKLNRSFRTIAPYLPDRERISPELRYATLGDLLSY